MARIRMANPNMARAERTDPRQRHERLLERQSRLERNESRSEIKGMRQIAAIASLSLLLAFPAFGGNGTAIPRSVPAIFQTPPAQDTTLADAQQALDRKDFARAATLLAEYLKTHPG